MRAVFFLLNCLMVVFPVELRLVQWAGGFCEFFFGADFFPSILLPFFLFFLFFFGFWVCSLLTSGLH